MRLAVFEGDVCASIEKGLAAHNIQAARRFPAMMRIPRGKKRQTRQGSASVVICEHRVS